MRLDRTERRIRSAGKSHKGRPHYPPPVFALPLSNADYPPFIFLTLHNSFLNLLVIVFAAHTSPYLFHHIQMRATVIALCFLLGALLCARWIVYYQVIANVIVENTPVCKADDRQFEAVQVTQTIWYITLTAITYILQYFVTGVCMIALSASNVRRLNALNRAHNDDQLRMSELARKQWARNHKVGSTRKTFPTSALLDDRQDLRLPSGIICYT